MLSRTLTGRRSAVALFNMKHFQSKHKAPLTPANIKDTFTTLLDPEDRLLRQSRAGAGSTRVLVLDKQQQVKGIYHPLLCLPHPSVVPGGESVLGLPIEAYLRAIEPLVAGASGATAAARKRVKPVYPTVMTVVSHPNGVAVGSWAANGVASMPLQNIIAPAYTSGLGEAADRVATPSASPEVVLSLIDALNVSYDPYLSSCSTYYFVVRDNAASLSLTSLQGVVRQNADDEAYQCRVSFEDRKWVTLPDTVLQTGRDPSVPPLYTRDSNKEKIVSPAGLLPAVSSGMLELDFVPKKDYVPRKDREPQAAPPQPS